MNASSESGLWAMLISRIGEEAETVSADDMEVLKAGSLSVGSSLFIVL